ncbi:hypothetical protein LJR219_002413 [Phenylobacterium sp. LjRoot219]|uniref:hypothetical protein n=1 Tax=Phenylobacterium sp. LjRoot219 TaxID=3342283 RepID=UPI003ECC5472
MEGILFLAEVAAFLIVVAWAAFVEHTGSPERGLLGMREEGVPAGPPQRAEPDWKRVPRRAPIQLEAEPEKPLPMRHVGPTPGPTPAWRRKLRADRWR